MREVCLGRSEDDRLWEFAFVLRLKTFGFAFFNDFRCLQLAFVCCPFLPAMFLYKACRKINEIRSNRGAASGLQSNKWVVDLAIIAADVSLTANITHQRISGGGSYIIGPLVHLAERRTIFRKTFLLRLFAALLTWRQLHFTCKTLADNVCLGAFFRTVVARHPMSGNDMVTQSPTLDTVIVFVLAARQTRTINSREHELENTLTVSLSTCL